jgi:hypothetical protein
MDLRALDREWELVARLLPTGWRELARSSGALRRARQVADADTLLRLILLHAASGLSLRQSVARARRSGLATLSDVALLKRMRQAGPWLQALARGMLERSPLRRPLGGLASGRRVRVVDGTCIREPGSTGTDWRIHYVLQLPSLECDFFELTDPSGAETFKRLPVAPGDVILGDRGYCHREGVAHVLSHGGDVVVRLNASSFPLRDEQGAPLELLPLLRTLQAHDAAAWPVRFDAQGKRWPARLCAVRKSVESAAIAQKKLLQIASKKGKQPRPETLEAAEYIFVLATVGLDDCSPSEVLELYRARWQVELVFKRMKTLFGAGYVPKYDPHSARAWIHAKLLAVLLIERLSQEARLFSPWGFPLQP